MQSKQARNTDFWDVQHELQQTAFSLCNNRCSGTMQVGVKAEIQSLQGPQQQEALQSLLQYVLDCFKKAVATTLQDLGTGALLQLLLELQYLHAGLANYVSSRLEQSFVELGACMTEQIQEAQPQEQQACLGPLSSWMIQSQGSDLLHSMQARLAQVLTICSTSQQCNLRALQQ